MTDATDDEHPNQAPAPAGVADERTHDPESVPLDLDEGEDVVLGQFPSGSQGGLGGGEHPDPRTPPQDPAPGGVLRRRGAT